MADEQEVITKIIFYCSVRKHGVMDHIYSFSGKLSVSSDTVQHGVEGLIYLLTESSKLMVRAFVGSFQEVQYTLCVSPGRISSFQ